MGHLDVHIRHGSGGGGEGIAALVLGAAMVAALGYRRLMGGERLDLDGDVFSRG